MRSHRPCAPDRQQIIPDILLTGDATATLSAVR